MVGEELEGDYFQDGGRSSWEAWGLDDVSALAIGTARLFQKIARGRGIRTDEVRQWAGRPPGNRLERSDISDPFIDDIKDIDNEVDV